LAACEAPDYHAAATAFKLETAAMSPFHLKFGSNSGGRDFIIGDLHGMLDLLGAALDARAFDPRCDRLFSVGDLIDRGVDSPGASRLVGNAWFHAVRGNHEDMLIRAASGEDPRMLALWWQNGGQWGIRGGQVTAEARVAAERLGQLPWVITLEHSSGRCFGICHAQCPVEDWTDIDTVADRPELRQEILWGRDRIMRVDPSPVRGIDWTIHGHTIVASPVRSANAVFIDTGGYRPEGQLTLLCLDELS